MSLQSHFCNDICPRCGNRLLAIVINYRRLLICTGCNRVMSNSNISEHMFKYALKITSIIDTIHKGITLSKGKRVLAEHRIEVGDYSNVLIPCTSLCVHAYKTAEQLVKNFRKHVFELSPLMNVWLVEASYGSPSFVDVGDKMVGIEYRVLDKIYEFPIDTADDISIGLINGAIEMWLEKNDSTMPIPYVTKFKEQFGV